MTVLLVVATILFFVGLDIIVRRVKEKNTAPAVRTKESAFPVRIPEGIFFAPNHTWVNLFPSGKVRMGIDDFIGRLLDNPTVLFLKRSGETVTKGEPILQLKQNGHRLTVRSPLNATVLAVNDGLTEHPENMKEMLFSDGWAYTMQPVKTTQLRSMVFGKESSEWIKHEFARLRDVLAHLTTGPQTAPILLQDGGLPVAGFMREAPEELWNAIDEQFLSERKG